MSLLLLAIVVATVMAASVFSPAFAEESAPAHPKAAELARPPQQDPTPTPTPGGGGGIIQNIFQSIQFPFPNLVEALQNALQEILRAAMEPIQMMFAQVLSLWLENPGIVSNGNAALPGWDLMQSAWQFMYSIALAFMPLTLAVVAAIAAKDAVAAATWGLGDLKNALGTWFVAVLLAVTSLWWMDLANNLANAITNYILYNFAGPQFFPGTFMVFFSVILPGLFLVFPLAGIIIILFLLILAITIFVALTFAIIARLVLMYLLVALGPLAIILGVLPPLRFVTHMWTRGLLLVLALGPIDALLLKLAFNVAQYASSAPPLQAVAAFIGVFGLLSILITINFTLVKTVFGAVIAVANQTMRAVQAVGQMVVAGALLLSGAGAGAGIALGGSAAGAASSGGGAGGMGGGGGNVAGTPSVGNGNVSGGNGKASWRPSGRGMTMAGNYLQATRGPLAGFGALLRSAGLDQMNQERAATWDAKGNSTRAAATPEQVGDMPHENDSRRMTPGNRREGAQGAGATASNATRASGRVNEHAQPSASNAARQATTPASGVASSMGVTAGATDVSAARQPNNMPPRRTNIAAIQDSRAAMGFDSGVGVNAKPTSGVTTTTPSSTPVGDSLTNVPDSAMENAQVEVMPDERGDAIAGETIRTATEDVLPTNSDSSMYAPTPTPRLAPEAERTLSMLPDESGEARAQAAQLASRYSDPSQQAQIVAALEQAMQTVHTQNGMAWSDMGTAMERGLWSTREAASHGIPLNDMARQMEPFTGTRESSDYLAWQIAGRGESFSLPPQQVAYLPAPGPYEYQAGQYIAQQLGGGMSSQEAAQLFYVLRDPSTPGGGWGRAQQFIGEVNRIGKQQPNDPLIELDRWMQSNAPTRARVLWNMRFKIGAGK